MLNNGHEIEQEHNSYWDYLRSDRVRYEQYYSFCVVRNPWDRVLSAYTYLRDGGNKNSDRILSQSVNMHCSNFEEFVFDWLNFDRIYNTSVLHPQFRYIYDFYNKKIMVDDILRYEKLSEDFKKVQSKIGLRGDLPLLNLSRREGYLGAYSKDMVQVIAKLYSIDIELFGYSFEEG